ncbi:hypothetical protein DRN75_00360 [Nanoarchaeota archaeon]|nr:MAG: hypothetical protein DRN75_00360 [Nanoarchaeota archaeon]
MYVDVHAHMYAYKGSTNIRVVSCSVDLDSIKKNVLLRDKYYIGLGIDPHEELGNALDLIREYNPDVIGEIGLDYYYPADRDEQIKKFESQLELAEQLGVPVSVHSRRAEKDVMDVLSSYNLIVNIHCFTGKLKIAKIGFDRGYFFSVPPSVVRSSHFKSLVKLAPKELILTESDAPYLGKPDDVKTSVNVIASEWGLSSSEAEEIIFNNSKRYLGKAFNRL